MINLRIPFKLAPLAALAALSASSCVTHPSLVGTEFSGLYVPESNSKTVNENIPGHGNWAMMVNEGEGYAYLPEDGKVSAYDMAGQPTASGELFDPDALTAAHRSLPLHTIVRITRVDFTRSVVVRINDRAAAMEGLVLQVTPKGAHALRLDEVGAAPCRVEILRYPLVETPPLTASTTTP